MWNTKSINCKEDIEKRVNAGYYKNLNESLDDTTDNRSVSKFEINPIETRGQSRDSVYSPEE